MNSISLKRRPVVLNRQGGAATIFIAAMLVVLASMLSLSTTRTVLFASKDTNNQYWAAQVHEVAQSGIEYAIAWLKATYDTYYAAYDAAIAGGTSPPSPPSFWTTASSANCPSGISGVRWVCYNFDPTTHTGMGVGGYTLTVRLARDILNAPNVALISSIAEYVGNNSRAEVQQRVYIPTMGTIPTATRAGANAPLIVNGCTSDFTGNPDICPQNATGSPCPSGASGPVGVAIHTMHVPDFNGDGLISNGEVESCINIGHLDIHGGNRTSEYATVQPPSIVGGVCNDAAWKKVFGSVTKNQMKAWSDAQGAAGLSNTTTPKRTVYWVDSSSNWHTSLGSLAEPVILIFSATACAGGCPKINGNPTIYGTIYLDTQCIGTRSNGWGGADIYGTVAVESDMEKLNANTNIYYNGNSGISFPPSPPASIADRAVQRISGAWKDW